MGLELLLFLIGSAGGFLSGLLGIGGGIILFPALLYLPQILGVEPIGVMEITGLTIMQGFVASFTAMLFYRSRNLINRHLVVSLGLPMALACLAGALASKRMNDQYILAVFGVLALAASLMMLTGNKKDRVQGATGGDFQINRLLCCFLGLPLGFMLGMVGQGGAFIILPMMIVVLKIPFRHAAGSMLAIGLMMSGAGFVGKAGIGGVPLALALPMLLGAVPLAWIGGLVALKVNTTHLRRILALIIMASTIRIFADLI